MVLSLVTLGACDPGERVGIVVLAATGDVSAERQQAATLVARLASEFGLVEDSIPAVGCEQRYSRLHVVADERGYTQSIELYLCLKATSKDTVLAFDLAELFVTEWSPLGTRLRSLLMDSLRVRYGSRLRTN